jgi:hypothetical protein
VFETHADADNYQWGALRAPYTFSVPGAITMKLILEADSQWDLVGDTYQNNQDVLVTFSDDCNQKFIEMSLSSDPGKVFYIKKEELKNVMGLF